MTSKRAKYVMIGGFLGAGKTTAVGRLAKRLTERGLKVGLITNDQSTGLADTSILRARGFEVQEIAGGCFCCRFASLAEAAENLEADGRPDVILAEPVGSCTDLVATVSYPLRRIYGDRYRIAPLSVLVDPIRARRLLGLIEGRDFSEKVRYVFEKQLEEADRIVVNKSDLLQPAELEELLLALRERYKNTAVLAVSAKDGAGTDAWFDGLLEDEVEPAPTMDVDYKVYAEGEALLGWYNASVKLEADKRFDANELLQDFAARSQAALQDADVEIAHLKATLDTGGQLAAISLVSSDGDADLREALVDGALAGDLILNLRAETKAEDLARVARAALAACLKTRPQLRATFEHEDYFQPSPPVPTHRDAVSS
jgi:G3E family GTPase